MRNVDDILMYQGNMYKIKPAKSGEDPCLGCAFDDTFSKDAKVCIRCSEQLGAFHNYQKVDMELGLEPGDHVVYMDEELEVVKCASKEHPCDVCTLTDFEDDGCRRIFGGYTCDDILGDNTCLVDVENTVALNVIKAEYRRDKEMKDLLNLIDDKVKAKPEEDERMKLLELLNNSVIRPNGDVELKEEPTAEGNHYRQGTEAIVLMEELFGKEAVDNFCILNAFKYIHRCEHKGTKEQDLYKAENYLHRVRTGKWLNEEK